MPELVAHVLPPSHPSHAVLKALELKGLEHERVDMPMPHMDAMAELYGEGSTTVPGLMVDGEPVHGSRPIMHRLDELVPDPPLYPSEAVREADRWGDEELQDLGRRLPWGALHFRPEYFGMLGGAGLLDPAGTDYAIKFIRAGWKYHRISAARLAEDLAGLPAKLDHADSLVAGGVVGDERPNAADLQIGSTIRVLMLVGDVRPLIDGRPCAELTRWFAPLPEGVPAGAFPAGWIPG